MIALSLDISNDTLVAVALIVVIAAGILYIIRNL